MSDRRRKRGQREGTIRKRGDGRWEARLSLGWRDGKRRHVCFYDRTRDGAQQQLVKALHDRGQGLPVAHDRENVAAFLTHWLEHTVRPAVRPRTHQSYELLTRLHVIPSLGRLQITKLTPEHIEALLARKLKAGLAAQTVRHIRTVLRRALAQALKRGQVARNVATMVDPPRLERRRQGHVPDAGQIRALLTSAADDRLMAPLLTLALTLATRRGELLGLRWSDLDAETGHLQIQQSVQRYTGVGLQATDPKTDRSRRTLTLPQGCSRLLRTWRAHQAQARLAAGPRRQDLGYIFTTPLGTPIDPRNLHRKFKTLLTAAGLPSTIRFHDLRHAGVSYLLDQGIPLHTVSNLLGHSGVSVTADIYGHITPQLLDQAAAKMDLLLSK